MAVSAQAQTWYPANQATVAWDAVTKLSNGAAIPAGDVIQYVVYTQLPAPALPVQVGTPVTAPQMVITFASEGKYLIGVKAQRVVSGVMVGEAAISWSNTDAATNSKPWGIQHYFGPGIVTGITKP